jgi:hypothetical protein
MFHGSAAAYIVGLVWLVLTIGGMSRAMFKA